MPLPEELIKKLGNPGIWAYVKKEHYEAAIKYLDEKLNQFHDKKRGGEEMKFKNFQYKDEITCCDFTHEPFKDDDIIIPIWRVDKKYLETDKT
jgi:hypothetical protein